MHFTLRAGQNQITYLFSINLAYPVPGKAKSYQLTALRYITQVLKIKRPEGRNRPRPERLRAQRYGLITKIFSLRQAGLRKPINQTLRFNVYYSRKQSIQSYFSVPLSVRTIN